MGYDIFSQLQGPQIDTNLFAQNATAGINAGNALPSTTTAIVQGLTKGVQTGLDINKEIQQSEIRQNQIDQQPVDNALKQTELDNNQAITEINQSKAKLQTATEALELQKTSAKLKVEADTAETALSDTETLKSMQEQLAANPTQALADLKDPAKAAALMRNPDAAAQIFAGMKAAGVPASEYKGLQSAVDGIAQRQIDIARQKAQSDVMSKFADERQKHYAEAEWNLNGVLGGTDVPAGYDPRDLKPTRKKNLADPAGPAELYGLDYKGKPIKSFISLEEMNRTVKDLTEVTSWQTAKGLLKPKDVPAEVPVDAKPPTSLDTFNKAAATPTPVPTAPPGAAVAPENLNDTIAVKSQDAVTQQARNNLLDRAKNDPDIRQRLIAKGVLKEGLTKPAPTPDANSVPTPVATPTPTVPAQQTPSPAVTPEAISTRVNEAHAALPAPVKKLVEPAVVKRVSLNPELQGLTSLQKAVASVESAGIRNAKPKGFDNKRISAEGYFQLTNGAASDTKVNKADPLDNVVGGTRYLNKLLSRYSNNEVAAVMAYNMGMGVIDSAISISGSADYKDLVFGIKYMQDRGLYSDILTPANVKTGVNYPLKVMAYKQVYQNV